MKSILLELTKLRIRIECLLLGIGISPKGEAVKQYYEEVLNGEIDDTNRIEEYEALIEYAMKENGLTRERACEVLLELIEAMPSEYYQ